MADSFTPQQVQGVFGEFRPVLDYATVTVTADNVQGVFGQFVVVLDAAATAPPVPPGPPEPAAISASTLAATADVHLLQANIAIERALHDWLVALGGETSRRGFQSAQRAFAEVADFLDGAESAGLISSRVAAQRIRDFMLTLSPSTAEVALLDDALRRAQDRTEA